MFIGNSLSSPRTIPDRDTDHINVSLPWRGCTTLTPAGLTRQTDGLADCRVHCLPSRYALPSPFPTGGPLDNHDTAGATSHMRIQTHPVRTSSSAVIPPSRSPSLSHLAFFSRVSSACGGHGPTCRRPGGKPRRRPRRRRPKGRRAYAGQREKTPAREVRCCLSSLAFPLRFANRRALVLVQRIRAAATW